MYEGNKVTLPDGSVFEAKTFGSKKEVEKAAALIALKALQPNIIKLQQQNEARSSSPKNDLQKYCQRHFNGMLPVYEGNKVTLPDGRVFEIKTLGSKKEMEKAVALVALNAVMSAKTEKSKTPNEGSLSTENSASQLNEAQVPQKAEAPTQATTEIQNNNNTTNK